MIKSKNRIALTSTLILAVLIVFMAALDPGGLFVIISWSGSPAVAAWWWWAPYVIFTPLLVLLNFVGVNVIVQSDAARWRRFGRIWALVILATALAWSINALVVLYGGMAGRDYVLSTSATVSFVLWASGYASLKMAAIGWIPALPGLIKKISVEPILAPASSEKNPSDLSGLALFMAGLGMLMLTLLSPWLAGHWWHGSPVGYTYRESTALLAPVADAGTWQSCLALLVCGGASWWCARGSFARLTVLSSKAAVFVTGAVAGTVAALALFIVQSVWLLATGLAQSSHGDFWFIPALLLLAVLACSFALISAACNGLAALCGLWLHGRLAVVGLQANRRFAHRGVPFAALALLISAALAVNGASNPSAGVDAAALVSQPVIPNIPNVIATEESAATQSATTQSAITVRHDADHAVLSDQHGAQIMLRGVNVNQLGEYYQADRQLAAVQTLTEQDFVDMASLGINSVRLTLSWSKLEPQRGQIDDAYLAKIKQAVDWAAQHQIYVVLDMHQDAWSATVAATANLKCRAGTEPMKGWDGAPGWATLTDDAPACQFTGRDLAPNVSRAFQSFYFDRDGIQTELIHVWAVIAANFADNPNVIGYDLLNEPNFAETPPLTSTLLLANFYARTIAAIRHAEHGSPHGYAHPVVIEPSIFWSGFGVDNLPPATFASDRQLVYSPHLYNESITSDQDLGIYLVSIERGLRLAQHAAARLDAALWIGEWGFFGDSIQQQPLWQRQANSEDQLHTGSAVWVWKQGCGDPHVYPGKVAGNIIRADCPDNQPNAIDPVVRTILQRAYPRAAPGRIEQFSSTSTGFKLTGSTAQTDLPHCGLQVWLPGRVQPRLIRAVGIIDLHWQRVEAGSALLGSDGGWIMSACVNSAHYQLETGISAP